MQILIDMQFRGRHHQYSQQYPEAHYWIVEENSEPIGSLVVDEQPNSLLGIDIAVLRSYRRKGFGSQLMDMLREMSTESSKPLIVPIMKSNQASLGMSLKAGMWVVGENRVQFELESRWEHEL